MTEVLQEQRGRNLQRRVIFATLALMYILVYFYRVSLAVVAQDVSRELQLSPRQLGSLSGILFFVYGDNCAMLVIPGYDAAGRVDEFTNASEVAYQCESVNRLYPVYKGDLPAPNVSFLNITKSTWLELSG